ncbi:MAG: hypothetical protein ACK4NZ_15115 [Tsuneonella sp.]
MKKLIAIASVAVLAACTPPAEEAPAPAETTAVAPAEDAAAAPGTYSLKYGDGTTGSVTINADGTYTGTDGKGVEGSGTWVNKDGKSCFDPEGDAGEMCWTDGTPDASGVFTSTADDGTTVTVTPQAATAAAPAAAAPAAAEAPAPE